MAYTELLRILTALIAAPGVSGSEEPVAQVVEAELARAGYAAGQVERDYLGSRWIRLGPEGQAERLLIAHMDEIGLRVTAIRSDGICRVQAVGGIDPQLWEGTPVVVHTSGAGLQTRDVHGCIAPVSLHVTGRSSLAPTARLKIEDLLLDVGAGSEAECRALGVDVLDPVTWEKKLRVLGSAELATRTVDRPAQDASQAPRYSSGLTIQARSLDDRFGCAALLMLAAHLRTSPPPVPTVLAWAVQEELGLRGAHALATRFPYCREVIAVDSYTVGSGPRDNKQFDSVRLGSGPAIRAWDATIMLPQVAFRAALAKAERLGVPLQYGFMQGGNDASAFEHTGAAVLGLGVPLAYSHSNVERVHLGDLAQLVELLAGWCGETA